MKDLTLRLMDVRDRLDTFLANRSNLLKHVPIYVEEARDLLDLLDEVKREKSLEKMAGQS